MTFVNYARGTSRETDRSPLARTFEEYTLNYNVGPQFGLYPIESSKMDFLGDESYEAAAGSSYRLKIDLGFGFLFDGITHKEIEIDTHGWACLLDPTRSSLTLTDVMTASRSDRNDFIKDQFSYNHVVLAPWFDDLERVFRTINSNSNSYLTDATWSIGSPTTRGGLAYTAAQVEQMKLGLIKTPPGIDSAFGRIKYKKTSDELGRCFVCRWKVFSFYFAPTNILTFDLVVRENGTIEFRYAPKFLIAPDSTTYVGASIGIFCHGGGSNPRYRDFTNLLRDDTRPQFVNGGAVYDGSYQDTDNLSPGAVPPASTVKYGVSLNAERHWPGLSKFGAEFVFSPPRRRFKTNRQTMVHRQSRDFVQRDSALFDDRLTQVTSTQTIEYPTMLPSAFKTTQNVTTTVNTLFQSGSITVSRAYKHGLSDEAYFDVDSKRNK